MKVVNEKGRFLIIFQMFFHLLKGHKNVVVVQALLSVLAAMLDLVSIALVIPIVSSVAGGVDVSMFDGTFIEYFVGVLSDFEELNALRYVLIFFFLTLVGKEIVMFLSQYYGARINLMFERDLRIQTLDKSYSMPFSSFSKIEHQEVFTTIVYMSANAARACGTLVEFLPLTVLILVNGIVLFSVSTIDQLCAGIVVVLMMLVLNSLLLKRIVNLSARSVETISVINGQVQRFVSSNKYLRQNNFEPFVLKTFVKASDKFTALSVSRAFLKQASPALQKIFGNAIIFMILVHATYNFPVEGGEWVAYVSIYLLTLSRVAGPTLRLNELRSILSSEFPATEKVWKFLKLPQEPIQKLSPQRDEKSGQALVLRNASFSYGRNDKPILKEINLEVPPGSFFGIVGKSGAGKSTLLDLITGIHKTTAGVVLLDGASVTELSEREWRKNMAIVSQKPVIFFDSLRNNICLGDDRGKDELMRLLKDVCLDDLVNELPFGLDTVLGQDGDMISGGQAQRIAIARAMYKKPSILILDEATSAQDPGTEAKLKRTLDNLRGKVTLLVVAHRLVTIKDADRICILDEGKIAAIASHDELLECSSLYRNFVTNQSL